MRAIQETLGTVAIQTNDQKKWIDSYLSVPYSWADERRIVGIEKDYRLAKTTKIATFLNGDGSAQIISGDGINRFSCDEYNGTILYSKKNKLELFDYVVANPPYSVDGFMQNFRRNKIDEKSNTFSLLKSINVKDSRIEMFFVERAEQLLKEGGIAAIILPQSILAGEKYISLRTFIFNNFRIMSMLLTADITFSGTTTSPVVLFLRKEKVKNTNYDVLIHQSPKYSSPKESKQKNAETKFLGYEFSSNKNKSGITLVPNSILETLAPITQEFICKGSVSNKLDKKYSKIVKLTDIIINKNSTYDGDIYPKRIIVEGKALSTFCKINNWKDSDFTKSIPTKYLEIGDLQTQKTSKSKKTNHFCKKGDILISSLLPEPSKIVIAKDDFMLSPAIHVLSSFKSNKIRDNVYKKLTSPNVINQMCALVDGFKITYAKISEENLYNNIFI